MNEHLKPVFEIILSALERAKIEYSVFGGIAVAGMRGYFYRPNKDVDVCVIEKDYLTARKILSDLALRENWRFAEDHDLAPGRPKYELFFRGQRDDFLSVIPVFKTPEGVVFKFYKNEQIYEDDIWNRQKQTIGNFTFYRFKDNYVKQLCLVHVRHLGRKVFEPKYRKYLDDLEGIISKEEFDKIIVELNKDKNK
ncbi:hypothetical protein D4R52_03610 [bacterium]|nr:MAG: hypothetical protein D4R52_03610 [bacterium]